MMQTWEAEFDEKFPPNDKSQIGKDDRFKSFIRSLLTTQAQSILACVPEKLATKRREIFLSDGKSEMIDCYESVNDTGWNAARAAIIEHLKEQKLI